MWRRLLENTLVLLNVLPNWFCPLSKKFCPLIYSEYTMKKDFLDSNLWYWHHTAKTLCPRSLICFYIAGCCIILTTCSWGTIFLTFSENFQTKRICFIGKNHWFRKGDRLIYTSFFLLVCKGPYSVFWLLESMWLDYYFSIITLLGGGQKNLKI